MIKLTRLFCATCEIVMPQEDAEENDLCPNCQDGYLALVNILIPEDRPHGHQK
jgi:RNA polymerase subunit RPABC4/transcription elongation factor Spt4